MAKEACENVFDDTPVVVANKPFSLLLEDCLSKLQIDTKKSAKIPNQQQTKPRFSYLKKGEGLRRYYKDPNQLVKTVYAPSVTAKRRLVLADQRRSKFGLPQQNLKLKPLVPKHNSHDEMCGIKNGSHLDVPVTSQLRIPSDCKDDQNLHPLNSERGCTWRNVLEQKKSVVCPLPEKTVQCALSYDDLSDGNHTLQENQELLAFELLEQHAANSSFSSSSSFVAALMERGFGSTPKKRVPSDFGGRADSLRRNFDLHEQYAQNYKKYISMHPKSQKSTIEENEEEQAENHTLENSEYNSDCKVVVDDLVPEERSLHVHFADEEGSEDEIQEISHFEETSGEKLDFKDESTWSNCSCSSCCSGESQVGKKQDVTCHDSNFHPANDNQPTVDYSKYPSMSVKTLKGILSPKKKPLDSKSAHSTTVDKPVKSTKNRVINVEMQTDDTETIFKSELLLLRLQDLQNEIDSFRSAKMELAKMKKDHEEDVRKFTKEKKTHDKKIKEEEERLKSLLEEERRRVAKERLVLQKYSKSLKDQPSKEEREEIQALKQQVADLQDELHKKESRWTAFQVRSRDRTKYLEKENTKLKQEISKLKEESQKKLKVQETYRPRAKNPTKIMNLINKQIGLLTTMNSNKTASSDNAKQVVKYQDKKSEHIETYSEENESSSKQLFSHDKPSSGGMFTETVYPNGDIEQKFENGRVKFYYAATKTFQTTEVNGTEIYQFPNGQTEYHYTDGSKKVSFADGSIKLIYTTGQEEWVLPDKTHWTVGNHGEKVVTLPNGDKEISTEDYLRREYSDGTVRILFPDGRQETRYPNGRLRVKNASGQLILDLMETK